MKFKARLHAAPELQVLQGTDKYRKIRRDTPSPSSVPRDQKDPARCISSHLQFPFKKYPSKSCDHRVDSISWHSARSEKNWKLLRKPMSYPSIELPKSQPFLRTKLPRGNQASPISRAAWFLHGIFPPEFPMSLQRLRSNL